MTQIDDDLYAATRDHTRRSYQGAARHFEVEWGGFLPAMADAIAPYLVDHAESLAINTLRQRLAVLAQWHMTHKSSTTTGRRARRWLSFLRLFDTASRVPLGMVLAMPAALRAASSLRLAQRERMRRRLSAALSGLGAMMCSPVSSVAAAAMPRSMPQMPSPLRWQTACCSGYL